MRGLADPIVRIPLRGPHARDRFALVDADLPNLLSIMECRWYVTDRGYVKTFDWAPEEAVAVRLHHLVLGGALRGFVDHVNRDKLDNRRENLRLADPSQSSMNRTHPPGRIAYRGVSPRSHRFHAKLRWRHHYLHLGDFDTARDAARVYDLFALLIADEFAVTNFDRARYRGLISRLRQHFSSVAVEG